MTSRFVPSLEALFKATTSGVEARLKDANSGLSWSFNVPRSMATSFVALLSKAVPGVNWLSSDDLQVRLSDDDGSLSDTPTASVSASDSEYTSQSYNSSPVDSGFFICRTAPGPWLTGQDSVELALERFRSERARGRQSAPRSSSPLSSLSQYRSRSASPQRLVVRRHTDYGPRVTRRELSRTIRTFEQHLLERGVRVERVAVSGDSEESTRSDSSSDSDSEASSSYSDDDDDMMTVTPAATASEAAAYDSISETEIDEESVHTVTPADGLSAEVEDLTLDADVDVDALPDLADDLDLDTAHHAFDTPEGIVTWTQQVPVASGSMLLDLEPHRDPAMVMVHEVLYDAKVSKSADTATFVKSKLAALPGWTETLLDIDAAEY
ncbi:hypothetical protein EXIGLDRAFT_784598 [Exidia glandulosa HHB12029]|uniref:Uncharacterized protein n=1 Tax=Exidia glandulosa HHB12029 TaxID=1314781 RepID=A0A165YYT8_EXIGL|nr:hypothetical protein EXIGLDRAFT_784598 [Exidia glandulosa HHB12029]